MAAGDARKIARSAGLLRRDWRAKGHTLSFTDVTIAAVALANGSLLLTDNRKHFPEENLELLPLPPQRMPTEARRGRVKPRLRYNSNHEAARSPTRGLDLRLCG